jgi:hypothetical protein
MNNVIRYNTFSNNLGSFVSFRNGNNNVAYGNFFINSSGIRFKQASNISVYNNYFFQNDQPLKFVDVSNYVMHSLGQPLHTFDADQITDIMEGRPPRAPKPPPATQFGNSAGTSGPATGSAPATA